MIMQNCDEPDEDELEEENDFEEDDESDEYNFEGGDESEEEYDSDEDEDESEKEYGFIDKIGDCIVDGIFKVGDLICAPIDWLTEKITKWM